MSNEPVQPHQSSSTVRILLIGDDEQTLTAMNITLRSAGFEDVTLCGDMRAVQGLIDTQAFSLAIVDLNVPHIKGPFAFASSKVTPPPVIVVACSTRTPGCRDEGAMRVSEYLVKPVNRQRLLEAVTTALGARPAGDC
jgi:DNA-binding NtrC family response regulator